MIITVFCLIITNSPSAKHISKRVCLSGQSCVATTPRRTSHTWLIHITTWHFYIAIPSGSMKAKRCTSRHWRYMNAWQRQIRRNTSRTWLIYITTWQFYIKRSSGSRKARRCTSLHWLYVNAWRRQISRHTSQTWLIHITTWPFYIAILSGSRKVNRCTNRQ